MSPDSGTAKRSVRMDAAKLVVSIVPDPKADSAARHPCHCRDGSVILCTSMTDPHLARPPLRYPVGLAFSRAKARPGKGLLRNPPNPLKKLVDTMLTGLGLYH